MQVRKFEARNMKEALEMVKRNLGPDAVILQAKDNSGKFGLGGLSSVEVTAAVSETTLRKKKIAEAKMTDKVREQFQGITATRQKAYIEKAFSTKEPVQQDVRKMRYVDILDEEEAQQLAQTQTASVNVEQAMNYENSANHIAKTAKDRIKMAAASALQAGQSTIERPQPVKQPARRPDTREVVALRNEINSLKQIIANFHNMPQTMITSHPGANEGINFELSPMYEKLTRAGVSVDNTVEMLKEAQEVLPRETQKKLPYVDAWVARRILDTTRVIDNALEKTKYHVFVGGAGQGKTSSLVKFASHMVIQQKKKIVILTTDTSRVGTSEQLKILSQILNVPFAVVRAPEDWQKIDAQLNGFDHILVDFPGLQMKSEEEVTFFSKMLPPAESGRKLHYVQSVLMKDENAFEQYKRYRGFGISDVVFTALDESNQHGIIYNFQKKFNLPLHSFGIGPNIPEDYEMATRERVVDLIFKLTKLKKG